MEATEIPFIQFKIKFSAKTSIRTDQTVRTVIIDLSRYPFKAVRKGFMLLQYM